ncbi:hypothetical protein A6J69_018810 [Hafnia paralvei]|nr:hypothetical protein A6J69_018810 [Hafnia paralvei]
MILPLTLASMLTSYAANAEPLKINDSVSVDVKESPASHPLQLLVTLPSGETQYLGAKDGQEVADETAVLSHIDADINGDGNTDIITSIPVGMVDNLSNVYLWDKNKYKEILPNSFGTCGGFSNMDMRDVLATGVFYSSCRSGPSWSTDAYKFTKNGKLYLYADQETNDAVGSDFNILQFDYFDRTYDESGKVISKLASNMDGDFHYVIKVNKIQLFSMPNENSPHKAYLIKGDKVDVLDTNLQEDFYWVKVKYDSSKGPLIKWVKAQDTEDEMTSNGS